VRTADSDSSSIKLNFHAKNVYIVVGGTGSLTVTRDGQDDNGTGQWPTTSHQIVAANDVARGSLDVLASKGCRSFSFTYG